MTDRVILLKGIGEPTGPASMLGQANWSGIDVTYLDWEASYGFVNPARTPLGPSFDASLADGLPKLRHLLDQGPALLAAYSGGNGLAHAVAEQGHPNLVGIAFLADPFQPLIGAEVDARDGVGFGTYQLYRHQSGVAGGRTVPGTFPVRWWSSPTDVICNAPLDSPVRQFADLSAAFSLADPAAWTDDLLNRLRRGRFQPLHLDWLRNPIGTARLYAQAAASVEDYLGLAGHHPSHQSYDLRIPLQPWTFATDEIADWARKVLA